jgi:hypothetical protein
LHYEIDMLHWTYGPPKRLCVRDSFVFNESFCMHARVLIDFFQNNQKCSSDAIAKHFTNAWYTKTDMNPQLRLLRRKITLQIAHLSYKRPNYVDRIDSEGREQLYNFIKKDIRKFDKHLKERFRPYWSVAGVGSAS